PDDLELAGVPLRHADHHVVDERAREAVQGPVLALVVGPRHNELIVFTPDRDGLGRCVLEGAVRALHRDPTAFEGDLDPRRNGDRLLTDARHDDLRYQTWHRTSPPTWRSRASRSVIRPWFVVRMAIPMPPSTRGTLSARV